MKVPFVDLHAQYISIKSEIDEAIEHVISQSSFIGGHPVKYFEEEFSQWLGISHCISCGNGTDAIEILLRAFGIGQGDEVIVPAHSWISTSEAVSTLGATPIFVDTLPQTYTINPEGIREKISKRTKAIVPVHLFGLPAEMDEILDIANEFNLKVLEDCAQAHGAKYKGKMVGTMGHAGSFSFYPGKNLGAYGDAGAMVTNDPTIAERARMIANHGQKKKHQHMFEGRNSRLDGLQAAILRVKLPHLGEWITLRREKADMYSDLLKDSALELPSVPSDYKHSFRLYVIQLPDSLDRDQAKLELNDKGIEVAIHYPTALPFLEAYSAREYQEDDYPVAAAMSKNILSLPIYPEITDKQQRFVCASLNTILE